MKLLVKYPSRSRPERFFQGLDSIYNNIVDMDSFHVSCTLDSDDETMNNDDVIGRILTRQNISIQWGLSKSKVHAVNRDLIDYGDIIMLYSDDVRTPFYGFDVFIRNCFDDLDTLVHIPDRDAKEALATVYIAGRAFYNRFGYIYHPSYSSLWCDNEILAIAKQLGHYKFIDCYGVIEHLNPAYGHLERDAMFNEQQIIGWSDDHKNFLERQSRNFDL